MIISVKYKSGKKFDVDGDWMGPMGDGSPILGTIYTYVAVRQGNQAILLDPRCTCIDKKTGKLLYAGEQ